MTMAAPQVVVPIDPQVIARAFVDQYYRILHRSPDQVYRFYQETSILSRPDVNGTMTSATTLQGINQKIMSMDVSNYFWEIETADAQPSYMNGVFIVVTGCLTGPDRVRRPFAQSFFLAPQETNGFFVLNDVLRVALDRAAVAVFSDAVSLVPVIANGVVPVEAANGVVHLHANGVVVPVPANGDVSVPANGEIPQASVTAPEPDVEENHISEPSKEDRVTSAHALNGDVSGRARAANGFENGGSGNSDNTCNGVVAPANGNKVEATKNQHVDEVVPSPQKDGPKKSYALIVMKGSPVLKPVEVAIKNPKVDEKIEKLAPAKQAPAKQATAKQAPAQEATVVSVSDDSVENFNEEQGYSIFVKNLPFQVKADELEEEYKKFGAIKPGGVQVRMNRFDRYCFGFVEFETLESMQAAIEAQPITINGRHVFCEEKRSSSRVVNGIHVRPENGNRNNNTNNTISNGPPRGGPPVRTNTGYRNDNSYRGGGRGGPPVRGRGGQRPMSGPMRPRDGYRPHHPRSYQDGNGFATGHNGPIATTPLSAA